jgi:hypothetical protein
MNGQMSEQKGGKVSSRATNPANKHTIQQLPTEVNQHSEQIYIQPQTQAAHAGDGRTPVQTICPKRSWHSAIMTTSAQR